MILLIAVFSGTILYAVLSSSTVSNYFVSIFGPWGGYLAQGALPIGSIFLFAYLTSVAIRTLHPTFVLFMYAFIVLIVFAFESGATSTLFSAQSVTPVLLIPILVTLVGTLLAMVPAVLSYVGRAGR